MKKIFLILVMVTTNLFGQNQKVAKDSISKNSPAKIEVRELSKDDIDNVIVEVPATDIIEEADYYIPFSVVEQIPLFKSCEEIEKKEQMKCFNEELKKHIDKTLKFPKKAKKEKIENNVAVVYQITENGEITNIQARARRPEHKLLFEEEAKRIISLLPSLIPGKHKGKVVKVNYATIIQFKL